MASSWQHGATAVTADSLGQVQLFRQTTRTPAFIVAFGTSAAADRSGLREVQFGPNSIDDNTFEAFFLQSFPSGAVPGMIESEFYAKVPRLLARRLFTRLIPVGISQLDPAANRVVLAEELDPQQPAPRCTGAALICAPEVFSVLSGRRILIQIKGDFILDATTGGGVDGNHIEGRLPSGDGIPGGTFWSWVTLR